MTKQMFHWSILSVVGVVTILTTGCTRSIELKSSPADLQPTITHSLPSHERVPLVTDSFQVSRNGAPQNPSTDAERRILNRVQETGLFSALIPLGGQTDSSNGKIVAARISMDETIDPHSWLSAFKGIIMGGSMFLLSPLIDFEYDYAAKVSLELERWDGQITRYVANSSGTVEYKLFGATPVMIEELKGHVMEACLTDITRQLVRDTTLYMASSAPLPDTSIRMVTVKSKRHAPIQSTHSRVPVATSTTP